MPPDEEPKFQSWYRGWATKAGIDPDPDNPLHKYDYRGAYRAKIEPAVDSTDGLYHWPSEFKDDDHPNRFVKGVDTKALDSARPLPTVTRDQTAVDPLQGRQRSVASRTIRAADILEAPDVRADRLPAPLPPPTRPERSMGAARPRTAVAPVTTDLATRAAEFESGGVVPRLARSAEYGLGQAASNLGLRGLGERLQSYAIPRPDQRTGLEKATSLATGLYATGAVAGGLASLAGAGLRRAGVTTAGKVGRVLFPEAGAGFGRRVAGNYLAGGSGPVLDVAYAAGAEGDLGDKARTFAEASLYSAGGAGVFEGIRSAYRGARKIMTTPGGGEVFAKAPDLSSTRGAAGAGQEDLFRPPAPVQDGLFTPSAGTAASRSLAETERAVRADVDRARQAFDLATDPVQRQTLAAKISEGEKLLNRGKAITPDEIAVERAAEPPARSEDPTLFDQRGTGGAEILAGMASGGAAGGVAGAQVGDDPDERLRNTLIGAGLGIVAGGAAGAKLAARSRFARRLLAPSGERGGLGIPVLDPSPDDAAKFIKKFKKVADDELADRLAALHARAKTNIDTMGENAKPWARYDDDIGMTRSGVSKNYTYGRAKSGLHRDDRLIAEVEWELRRRGFTDDQLDGLQELGLTGSVGPEKAGVPLRAPAPPGYESSPYGRETDDAIPPPESPTVEPIRDDQPSVEALLAPPAPPINRPPVVAAAPAPEPGPKPAPAGIPPTPPPDPPKAAAAAEGPSPEEIRSTEARKYLNIPRFQELDARLRGVLEEKVLDVAKAGGRVPKERVPWDAVRADAEGLLTNPERLLSVKPERMTQAESLAMATVIQSNVKELDRLGGSLRTTDALEDVQALGKTMAALDEQTTTLLDKLSRGSSDAGRRLNALKILAGMTDAAPVWMLRATQHAERPLTDLERSTIERLIGQGQRAEMLKFVGGLRRKPLSQSLIDVWKAGLLTNPSSHVVNVTGNTTLAVAEQVARNPATMADWVIGKLGKAGVRTKATGFSVGAKGFAEGVAEAGQVMKGLPVGDDLILGRIHERSGTSGNALVDAYTNTIFRLLGATDRLFNRMAFQSSLSEQASVLANLEGLKGKPRAARIKALLTAPTDEMAERAMDDALVRTFQDETIVGRGLTTIQKSFDPVTQFAVPFTKTPGAIATRMAEYTPLGFLSATVQGTKAVKGIREAVKNAKPVTPELKRMQQAAAEAFGRGVTGTAIMAAGYYLYQNGLASGIIDPDERTKRQTQQLANIPTDGIRIPGTHYWVEPSRMGIPAMVMLMGAAVGQATDQSEEKGPLSRVGEGLGAYLRIISDQPFFRGLDDLLELRKGAGSTTSRYARNLAGSFIPAGVAALTRATDDKLRQAGTLKETLYSRLPGLSRTLPAQVNQLGEDVNRPSPGFLNNMLSPMRVSEDRMADPLIGDLYGSGAAIGRLKKRKDETSTGYTDRARMVGSVVRQQLEAVRAKPGYATAGAEARAEVFEGTARKVRTAATKAEKKAFLQSEYQAARRRNLGHGAAVEAAKLAWDEVRR